MLRMVAMVAIQPTSVTMATEQTQTHHRYYFLTSYMHPKQ
uniref:Uncharacterized protein n=1 Tax=Arundo donax TaxID=35708 RepID=A0A0A8YVL9_ARUDO